MYKIFAALFMVLSFLTSAVAQEPARVELQRAIASAIPLVRRAPPDWKRHDGLQRLSESLAVLGYAEQAIAAAPDEKARDEALRLSARRQAQMGQIAWATRTAARIKGYASKVDALLAIARAHLRAGQFQHARDILYRASPLARTTRRPDVLAYLAWLLVRADDREAGKRLFQAAQQQSSNRKTPDGMPSAIEQSERESDQRSIAYYQAKAGFDDEAIATAGSEMWGLFGIVDAFVKAGHFDSAKQAAARFNADLRVRKLTDIAMYQVKAGRRGGARATVNEVRALLGSSAFQSYNVDGWIGVALAYAMLGEMEEAHQIFAQTQAQPGFAPIHAVTFWLNLVQQQEIRSQLRAEEKQQAIEKAWAAIEQMPADTNQIGRFGLVAEAQKQSGDMEVARQTLQTAADAALAKLRAEPKIELLGTVLNIAQMQRKVGEEAVARQNVRQAIAIVKGENAIKVADLSISGFFEEALKLLLQEPPENPENYESLARIQAAAQGGQAPLKWITRLSDPINRAFALAGATDGIISVAAGEEEMVISGGQGDLNLRASS